MATGTIGAALSIPLRPYQVEAHAAVLRCWRDGDRRVIINLPTGTGKTVTALSFLLEHGGRWLWLAHRDELIQQAVRTALMLQPGVSVGIVQAAQHQPDADLVVASVPSLVQPSRLRSVGSFSGVVIDEAHHAVARTYQTILRSVGAFEDGGPPVVGLTATLERGDEQALDRTFQRVAYQMPLLAAIRNHYLADLAVRRVTLPLDLGTVPTGSDGDFQPAVLDQALLAAGVADAVAAAYVAEAAPAKALVFTVSVEQARLTAEALVRRGVAAEWVSGTTPSRDRRGVLARLHTGDTRVVCNCGVLTEGFDEPSLGAVVLARPTQSKSLYLQMLGRGLRTYPHKSRCLVIDVVGNTVVHNLVQAPVLFGLPPVELESVVLAVEEAEGTRTGGDDRDLRGTTDLAARVLAAQARASWEPTFRWLDLDLTARALDAGKAGVVVIRSGATGWEVASIARDGVTALATGLDEAMATGIAEDYIRRAEASGLVRNDAAWRREPMTSQQAAALKRWRVTAQPGWTKGDASDRLTQAIARARIKGWAS